MFESSGQEYTEEREREKLSKLNYITTHKEHTCLSCAHSTTVTMGQGAITSTTKKCDSDLTIL